MALISCPECKKEISDRAHSCPSCGFPLDEYFQELKEKEEEKKREEERKKQEELVSVLSQIAEKRKTEEIRVCPFCGGEISADSRFCGFCGNKVTTDYVICTNCGKQILAIVKFCKYCGTRRM